MNSDQPKSADTTVRKAKILIVEDEEAIRAGLVDVLLYHGFDVECAEDGNSGWRAAQTGRFDLILLDVMLPGLDGYQICQRIREQDREQAIIMLTAKSADEDIILGLSLGADDYVAKPFSVTQLVLRIKAVLRRSHLQQAQPSFIKLGEHLRIDTLNLSASSLYPTQDNTDSHANVSFTRREMQTLEYLHQHSERPVPREELLSKVWGYAKSLHIETRTVDIHIAKLRRKIEPQPSTPQFLVTVRGAGYKLICDD